MTVISAPESDVDLYSTESLQHPYPDYARLRQAGPVVRLSRPNVWALPRYEQVREALLDHETFSSGSGVGFDKELNGLISGSLIASDPPRHDALRAVVARMLMPRALRDMAPAVTAAAEVLIDRLASRGEFDAVTDLAQDFPVNVVADLIGLPEEGRDQLLAFASATFDSMGPSGERTSAALEKSAAMIEYITTTATPDRLREGGFGARIWEAVAAGEVDEQTGVLLMAAFVTAGMDTTAHSLSASVRLFGEFPQQWDLLRSDPSKIPAAYLEVLRIASPVRMFSRVTTRNWECEGITIPAGDRVAVMYASANRDERKWTEPERFDITRNPLDHISFGFGIHACVGQGLAKLEAHAILAALLARVRRFEIGEPEYIVNSSLLGLATLPCKIIQ
ncbi:cytochrome P450 (plasmid) [Arthrobacter sp. D3-18]